MKIISIKKCLFTFLILFVCAVASSQNIVINEVVSSNNTIIQDCDGDFSDWIELHNLTAYDIDLVNYKLSDNSNSIGKWVFPDIVIHANSYLIVFASNKDKFQNNELHTNFKISQSGEPLILSNSNGEILSEIAAIYIPTDNSYARISDNSEAMIITNTPTPNSANIINEGIYCSHQSGFYNNNIKLELVNINNSQQIFYTLNGEIPSVNSHLYTEPITIENNSETPYSISGIPTTPLSGPYQLYNFIWKEPQSVYKCNIVRYAAFENGILQGKIYSKSYFIDSEIGERYEYPVVSLITDSLNLFDYDTGIYIPGKRFDENGFNWWPEGNYHNRGNLWERDVYISYFGNKGESAFETDAGMRMRGYGSASYPQKSFIIYFRKEYGKSKIEYPIFNNPKVKKYKRLILRNSGNDFTQSHFKDAMLQEVMSTMNLEKQDFKPSVVFINGEYWGIYNLREKYDKYYFKYKYGIDKDSINILGICGNIEEGDNTDYISVTDFVKQNDLSIDDNYIFVSNKIDIENFIDFQIAEIFFANYDWPCNNFKIWKDNKPNSKWRFMIYDLDCSFSYDETSSYLTKSMEHATSTNDYWPHCKCSNLLFRQLLTNEDFKNQFIEKFAYHLKNTFSINRVTSIIDSFALIYSDEIEEHMARWGYPDSFNDWENKIAVLNDFANKRPCSMTDNIMTFFNLSEFDFDCTHDVDTIKNNENILLFPNPSAGRFSLHNGLITDIEKGRATLVNSIGQVVFTQKDIFIAPKQQFYFNLNNLSKGVYLLIFEYNSEITYQKVVITPG